MVDRVAWRVTGYGGVAGRVAVITRWLVGLIRGRAADGER